MTSNPERGEQQPFELLEDSSIRRVSPLLLSTLTGDSEENKTIRGRDTTDTQSLMNHRRQHSSTPPYDVEGVGGTKAKTQTQKKRSVGVAINDWFIWEVIAVVGSAGMLIAMVAVLAAYNQRPQPNWTYMSLNSLISWLSTFSKACILFSVNEALGQLKWTWFAQKMRPLPNLRTFDSASRGLYGSMELIWTLRARHFAVLGSLTVILAVGFDPFAQNLVHYFPNMVADSSQTALVGNVSTYNTVGPDVMPDSIEIDPMLKANVYNSLFNIDQTKPWSIPQYFCSSKNCTWDPVTSLEARPFCANITHHLTRSCGISTAADGLTNCTLTLPTSNTSVWFVPGAYFMTPFAIAAVDGSSASVYTNASFLAIQMIAPESMTNSEVPVLSNSTHWEATECVVEPVVRSFRASVQDNVYTDETLAIWIDRTPSNDSNNVLSGWNLNPTWGVDLGMQPNQNYAIGFEPVIAINAFFGALFSGTMAATVTHTAMVTSSTAYATSDVLQALAFGNITGCGVEIWSRLNCSMQNVAEAMTKTFRDSAYILANSDPDNAQMAIGRALVSITYISVHWQWITLPVLVWLLGAAMLIGTLWKTRRSRVPKWKNDPLPLLFLYQNGQRDDGQGATLQELQEVDNMRARLYENDEGIVLGAVVGSSDAKQRKALLR